MHTYIPPFGAGVRYVCKWRNIHTYIPPFGGGCEVCMLCEQADSGLPRESHSSSCLFCSLVSRLAADATDRANSQAQWLEPKPIDSAHRLEPKYNEFHACVPVPQVVKRTKTCN